MGNLFTILKLLLQLLPVVKEALEVIHELVAQKQQDVAPKPESSFAPPQTPVKPPQVLPLSKIPVVTQKPTQPIVSKPEINLRYQPDPTLEDDLKALDEIAKTGESHHEA